MLNIRQNKAKNFSRHEVDHSYEKSTSSSVKKIWQF